MNWQEQVTNLTKDLSAFIKAGLPIATEEKRKIRLDICGSCEYLLKQQKRCGLCGCFIEIKSVIDTSKCPVEKWA